MSIGHPRFTKSSISYLRNFKCHGIVGVLRKDFKSVFNDYPKNVFFCDPPYYINQNLYGNKGDHHVNFNHEDLCNKLLNHKHPWLLCYNDCAEIRQMYNGCEIIPVNWTYGMNKSKKSSELIIRNNF